MRIPQAYIKRNDELGTVIIRMKLSTKERLSQTAKELGTSMARLSDVAIQDWLDRYHKRDKKNKTLE